MSDYRNPNYGYREPEEDPFRNDPQLDPNVRAPSAAWGWIAAAVFLVIVLEVAFGYGHRPGQLGTNTASNDVSPPAATHMTPPATITPPSTAPASGSPTSTAPASGTPTPPVTGAPNTQQGGAH